MTESRTVLPQNKWVGGKGSRTEEYTNGHKETSGDDRYVHCLDCVDGFMGTYICPHLSNCTFYIYAIYINFTSKIFLER